MFSDKTERQEAVLTGLRKYYNEGAEEIDLMSRVLTLAMIDYGCNPDDARSNYHLGMALSSVNRYKETPCHFEKAIELEPDNLDMRCDYAMTLLYLGMPAAAMKHVEAAEKIDGNCWDVAYSKGNVFECMGKRKAAITWYEVAKNRLDQIKDPTMQDERFKKLTDERLERLVVSEESPGENYNMGKELAGAGNYVEALPFFANAVELDPRNRELRFDYGKALWNNRQTKEARRQLNSVMWRNLEMVYRVADFYEAKHRPVWAVNLFDSIVNELKKKKRKTPQEKKLHKDAKESSKRIMSGFTPGSFLSNATGVASKMIFY